MFSGCPFVCACVSLHVPLASDVCQLSRQDETAASVRARIETFSCRLQLLGFLSLSREGG